MLIDFGVVVKRSSENIFKLHSKWLQRPAVIYLGKLVDEPAIENFKTREKLMKLAMTKFVEASIAKVKDDIVELLLVHD